MLTVTERLQPVLERLAEIPGEAVAIWLSGGWAMIAIAVIALAMFGLGINVFLRLRRKGFGSVPEARWRRWIDHPDERRGPIGELLDLVTDSGAANAKDVATRFEQVRMNETVPFERDLRLLRVCVSAAPLLGLLGTVTGMLSTFGALASGAGGEKTMAMIASGISEALITTETGLVVALPGLFFLYLLTRKYERYRAFLAHLETVCNQTLRRRQRAAENRFARRAALREVARRLVLRTRPKPRKKVLAYAP
jgi:biopolymer transport protein ExbB